MKQKHFLLSATIVCSILFISCGGKDKKGNDDKTTTESTTKTSGDNNGVSVPVIDTASLKDETSILEAMKIVVDGRMADEKKQKEDPNYDGHYLEFTKLYTAVLSASTKYSKTISDPAKAIEFHNKISAITDKMYEK